MLLNTTLPGLVAYYPFNGNANDESGNGNNGTVNGAVLTSDRFGTASSAYDFSSGNITAPANYLPVGNTARTISSWIYASNFLQPDKMIVGWGQPSVQQMSAIAMGLGSFADGKPGFWGYSADLAARSRVSDNRWHHVVFTFDTTLGKLYLDGKLDTSRVLSLNTSSGTLYIGDYYINVGRFSGSVDDIRIYNRALSETEIDSLYHEGGWPGDRTLRFAPFAESGQYLNDQIIADTSSAEFKSGTRVYELHWDGVYAWNTQITFNAGSIIKFRAAYGETGHYKPRIYFYPTVPGGITLPGQMVTIE